MKKSSVFLTILVVIFIFSTNVFATTNVLKVIEKSSETKKLENDQGYISKTIVDSDEENGEITIELKLENTSEKKVQTTTTTSNGSAEIVLVIDDSGSMSDEGEEQLVDAMDYILTYEKASKDSLQFSEYDKITVIPFSSSVIDVWNTTGKNTNDILDKIRYESPYGSTALYDAIERGIEILDKESDDYTKTIIAMTDGEVNVGSFGELESVYKRSKKKVPVYSITLGDAQEKQLEKIADLTNSKVFDGRTDLLRAFKEVRSYN